MDQQLFRPGLHQGYPLRESGDFNNTGRIMLVRNDDEDKASVYDVMHREPSVAGDDHVNLVQESFPNYARIDHFAAHDVSAKESVSVA